MTMMAGRLLYHLKLWNGSSRAWRYRRALKAAEDSTFHGIFSVPTVTLFDSACRHRKTADPGGACLALAESSLPSRFPLTPLQSLLQSLIK